MDIKKNLEHVFGLLSVIPVQGDNVEIMYRVRQELRTIYNELPQEKEAVQCEETHSDTV